MNILVRKLKVGVKIPDTFSRLHVQYNCTYSYLVTKIQQVDVGNMHYIKQKRKGENTIKKKHSVLKLTTLPFSNTQCKKESTQ